MIYGACLIMILKPWRSNFSNQSDGLWGVYRFKRGFGGELRRAAGPWDRVYKPFVLLSLFTVDENEHQRAVDAVDQPMDAQAWNSLISNFPDSHILQTWEWGDVKSQYGWRPIHAIWYEKPDGAISITVDQQLEELLPCAAALILQRDYQNQGISDRLETVIRSKRTAPAGLEQRCFTHARSR